MKRLLTLLLCALLSLPLGGCAPKAETRTTFAMDTFMTFTVYGGDEDTLAALTALPGRLDKLLSVTQEDSEVYALNHSNGQPVSVSEDTAALLEAAAALHTRTDGALDITLYPVVRAWGFTTDSHQVPTREELNALLPLVNGSAVTLENDAVTLPEGMELDFGAIAKGYAGKVCAQLLRDAGITSAILSLGGNVQTVGAKPDGSPWQVAVQAPSGEEGDTVGTLSIVDKAAVTSGGYQRYFEADGTRYCHIIDPATGLPVDNDLLSVTIVGDDGAVCDGLSTALYVMGLEEALDFWRANRDFEALLMDTDHNLWVTAGLAGDFTPAENSIYTTIIVEE